MGTAVGCDRAPTRPAAGTVSGTIETDEVRVASRYGGRVEKIHAQEGDSLQAGQVLIELQATELKARHEHAVALLAELEAGPRKEEIAVARQESEAVAAELDLARIEGRRAEELFAKSVVAAAERDRAVLRVAALEKNVAAAKSRLDLLLAGTRIERIAQAKAQVAEIETQVREMKIVSPTNCVLEVLNVKVGDVLPAHREAATLIVTQHLWVRVFVPEPWLGHVKLGGTARVRSDSFAGQNFTGTIEQIAREAEFTPRNVQTPGERIKQVFAVKVRLPADGALRPGMSVDVMFPGVAETPLPKSR